LISQSLGAGNKKGASRIAALSITFSLIFGIIISAILMFFNKPILSFIGATGQILEFGSQSPLGKGFSSLKILGFSIFLKRTIASTIVPTNLLNVVAIATPITPSLGIPNKPKTNTTCYNLSQLVITSMVLKCLTDTDLITKTYVQNITMFFYIFAPRPRTTANTYEPNTLINHIEKIAQPVG